jgi:hypothetical protein
MKRGFNRLLLVALSAVGCAAAMMTPAQASTDAALPVLIAGAPGAQGFAHQCIVIYQDLYYQAVFCADITTGIYNGGYYAWGQAEAYCQTYGGDVVQCDAVSITSYMYNQELAAQNPTLSTATCSSPTYPCAPNGQRNYYHLNYLPLTASPSDCSTNVNSDNALWTVVYHNSYITLPDGNTGYLESGNDGGNESTGHYFVCP